MLWCSCGHGDFQPVEYCDRKILGDECAIAVFCPLGPPVGWCCAYCRLSLSAMRARSTFQAVAACSGPYAMVSSKSQPVASSSNQTRQTSPTEDCSTARSSSCTDSSPTSAGGITGMPFRGPILSTPPLAIYPSMVTITQHANDLAQDSSIPEGRRYTTPMLVDTNTSAFSHLPEHWRLPPSTQQTASEWTGLWPSAPGNERSSTWRRCERDG